MKPLDRPDSVHLEAAKGWLGLGDLNSANDELERIAPLLRAHPDVLALRCEISMRAKKWDMASEVAGSLVMMVPRERINWINRSVALHSLKRTQKAFDLLLPAAELFPNDWQICYNLSCYLLQLGFLSKAEPWLEKAFDLGDSKAVKMMALDDPAFESLWTSIAEV